MKISLHYINTIAMLYKNTINTMFITQYQPDHEEGHAQWMDWCSHN